MQRFKKGWNIGKYIVRPEVLRRAFAGYHHVNFQSRVPQDYTESNPETFFGRYAEFYAKLAASHEFAHRRDHGQFRWYTGLSDDLAKCTYRPPFQDEKDKQWYKTSDFSEPCVGVGPFTLLLLEDGKLHTNYSHTQFPQFCVGVQIAYPKLFVRTAGGEVVRSDPETYCVYAEICGRLQAETAPLRFAAGGKTFRPRVRIGRGAQDDFEGFFFAKTHGCRLV